MFECGTINGEVVGKSPVRPLTALIPIDSGKYSNVCTCTCAAVREGDSGLGTRDSGLAHVNADGLFHAAVVMKPFANN